MDYHKIENITIEGVKAAHMADIAIQDKYGVKYHQFWVNEEAGSVFCLVEGPDKQTCEHVHQLAHGNLACALTQVEAGLYQQLMGKEYQVTEGHVHNKDGSVDTGYRSILVTSVYALTRISSSKEIALLQGPLWARRLIAENIKAYCGREVVNATEDCITGVFNDAGMALDCAVTIQKELKLSGKEPPVIFRIGINTAQPVTEKGDFFKEAMRLAHWLSITAQNSQILLSTLAGKLCQNKRSYTYDGSVKFLHSSEELFISSLLKIAEERFTDYNFKLDDLSLKICVSRPQLYRKVTALTGRSPNDFIRDFRMDKAIGLLRQKDDSIAEIAFKTGFNSPSYFAKCFSEKFGCTPSEFVRSV